MKTSKILTRLGGICAVIAFFFPWLAFPQADPDFPGFYSYTPFRLMGDATIVPNQPQAAWLLLLLVPIGALILIFAPLHKTAITRAARLKEAPITRAALMALLLGNALMALPVLSFYMLAFGPRSTPSAPDIGFWATLFALLLTLTGLAITLHISRASMASRMLSPVPEAQNGQRAAVLSIPSNAQPVQDRASQDV
ncbi:MAG TPA: hypothetical protein VFU32_07065 [Ktedonobacterales bacterium]|nr:hypothetical protein [Ktedonobacterales bacterium]